MQHHTHTALFTTVSGVVGGVGKASIRRQTAAVFFFDSASSFRGSPERSGGNPGSVANLFA